MIKKLGLTRDRRIRVSEEIEIDLDKGEIRLFGVRGVIIDPISCCRRIDKMLGSGSEVIIHNMWFEHGYTFLAEMVEKNPERTRERLLEQLVQAQPVVGWGRVSFAIIRRDPPLVEITVKNPPFRGLKGSSKRLVSSFWEGVFSKYFERSVSSENLRYDEGKEEFKFALSG